MSNSRVWRFIFALVTVVCTPIGPAHALWFVSYVSGRGVAGNDCSRGSPCLSFAEAIAQTAPGGQIVVLDAYAFGPAFITQSLTIVNDTAGTAVDCCAVYPTGGVDAEVVIAAGPNDVVSLRGITFNPSGNVFPNSSAVLIQNAQQVNIEKCTIRNETGAGILLAPSGSQLAATMNVKIEDTIVTGSIPGVKITSVPGQVVNLSISRSSVQSNLGNGIRIDGAGGGVIRASISDTVSSMNVGNGIVAISGPGDVRVNVTRSVMHSNSLSGVQSNQASGGSSIVAVNSSTITSNSAGAVNSVGGGALQSFGDNRIFGPNGTGFTGAIGMQ